MGGLPGTGTTTACRTLSARSGLRHEYVGELFRKLASERGMTLAEFGTHAEAHPEVDRALDDRTARLLRGAPVVLEGRLAGYVAFRDRVPAVKAWFTCDPYERARRIVDREGGHADARMAEMRRREESERKRYLALYGYDIADLSVYDLVLDTTKLSREEVVAAVEQAYAREVRPRRWWWPLGR